MTSKFTIIPFSFEDRFISVNLLRDTVQPIIDERSQNAVNNLLEVKGDRSPQSAIEYLTGVNEFNEWIDYWGSFARASVVIEHVANYQDDPDSAGDAAWITRMAHAYPAIGWSVSGVIFFIALLGFYKEQEASRNKKLQQETLLNEEEVAAYYRNSQRMEVLNNCANNAIKNLRQIEYFKKKYNFIYSFARFIPCIENGELKGYALILEENPFSAVDLSNGGFFAKLKPWLEAITIIATSPGTGGLWSIFVLIMFIQGIAGVSLIAGSAILSTFLWIVFPLLLGPANYLGKKLYNWLQERHPPSSNKAIRWLHSLFFKPLESDYSLLRLIGYILTVLVRCPLGTLVCLIAITNYYLIYKPLVKPWLKTAEYEQIEGNEKTYQDNEIDTKKSKVIKKFLSLVKLEKAVDDALRTEEGFVQLSEAKVANSDQLKINLKNKTSALSSNRWTKFWLPAVTGLWAFLLAFAFVQFGIWFWQTFATVLIVGWTGVLELPVKLAFALGLTSFILAGVYGIYAIFESYQQLQKNAELKRSNDQALDAIFSHEKIKSNPLLAKKIHDLLVLEPAPRTWYQFIKEVRTVTGSGHLFSYFLRAIVLPNFSVICFGAITVGSIGGPWVFIALLCTFIVIGMFLKYIQFCKDKERLYLEEMAEKIIQCNESISHFDRPEYMSENRAAGHLPQPITERADLRSADSASVEEHNRTDYLKITTALLPGQKRGVTAQPSQSSMYPQQLNGANEQQRSIAHLLVIPPENPCSTDDGLKDRGNVSALPSPGKA